MQHKHKTSIFLILLFSCTAALVLIWHIEPYSSNALPSVEVELGDIEDAITAVGILQPARYVDVGVQVSGQIQSIPLTVGDKVSKGMLLAVIDPAVQQAAVEAGQALLESQRAAIRQQEARYNFINY